MDLCQSEIISVFFRCDCAAKTNVCSSQNKVRKNAASGPLIPFIASFASIQIKINPANSGAHPKFETHKVTTPLIHGDPLPNYGDPREGGGDPPRNYGLPPEKLWDPPRSYGDPSWNYGDPPRSYEDSRKITETPRKVTVTPPTHRALCQIHIKSDNGRSGGCNFRDHLKFCVSETSNVARLRYPGTTTGIPHVDSKQKLPQIFTVQKVLTILDRRIH